MKRFVKSLRKEALKQRKEKGIKPKIMKTYSSKGSLIIPAAAGRKIIPGDRWEVKGVVTGTESRIEVGGRGGGRARGR